MIPTLYEPFRHWSDGGSVYILSDLHFDDKNTQKMDPDWIDADRQISIINSVVGRSDTFICLGDVGDPKYVSLIHARKKILLLGNHDARGAYRDCFDEVYTGPLFIAEKILLSHEPVHGLHWCLNIHGHDHNNIDYYREGCKHVNLAANLCNFTPVNLGKLIKDGVMSDIKSIHRYAIEGRDGELDRSCRTRKIYRIEQIKTLLEPIFKDHDVKKAILFGSYAKGMASENSDVDILVDSDLKGLAFFGLLNDIVEVLKKEVDLFDYRQFDISSQILTDIQDNGVVIYER